MSEKREKLEERQWHGNSVMAFKRMFRLLTFPFRKKQT